MSFRCELSGEVAPPRMRPVVVRLCVAAHVCVNEDDDSVTVLSKEVVRELKVLPRYAPDEREILLPGYSRYSDESYHEYPSVLDAMMAGPRKEHLLCEQALQRLRRVAQRQRWALEGLLQTLTEVNP